MRALTARHWLPLGVAAVVVALAVFLITMSALGVGVRSTKAADVKAAPAPLATFSINSPHVLSSITVYPRTGGFQTPGPQDLSLRLASQFVKPIAEYRAYALGELKAMEPQIARLESALAANDRAGAQAAWRAAYADYLRLGAVYLDGETAALQELATLNQKIDGSPGGLPGGTSSPRFTGLHRIEAGLWTNTPPSDLVGQAQQLGKDVRRLQHVLPRASASITPLEYGTRAHEILEDAQRDLLSGVEVPWSGEGVLATHAGLEATEEIVSTLHPVFTIDQQARPVVEKELALLRSTMASIAAAHGGRLPANDQLTQQQRELLDGVLGGTLEALSQVPVAMETEPLPKTPSIPHKDEVIDP
jgi:iron uptake system EfeUOB component EfeO/EfeM